MFAVKCIFVSDYDVLCYENLLNNILTIFVPIFMTVIGLLDKCRLTS